MVCPLIRELFGDRVFLFFLESVFFTHINTGTHVNLSFSSLKTKVESVFNHNKMKFSGFWPIPREKNY